MSLRLQVAIVMLVACLPAWAQEIHDHPAPEKLGSVSFPVSCDRAAQAEFNRGVALLHSFAYADAQVAFQRVASLDAGCAMAQWGIAMTSFRQLWEPALLPVELPRAQVAVSRARQLAPASKREREFIDALSLVFKNASSVAYKTRVAQYQEAMKALAEEHPDDLESQVFYALALLAGAPPTDKTHAMQKQAVAILKPLYEKYPDHPGIPHYLIHACDNAELAGEGLPAARVYAHIAPSAPHALHMPSHIFTRLGLWNDSITSNLAAREAAHLQHDLGEELHAMDYLVYAYLQLGRDEEAAAVVGDLKQMPLHTTADFKSTYPVTAMPVRYAVERQQWSDAAAATAQEDAPLHVQALAVWARGIGLARGGHAEQAAAEVDRLREIEAQLRTSGSDYWAQQVGVLAQEVAAWRAQAEGKPEDALGAMRAAADQEDAVEKLPITPGPVVPAREQLGEMLLEQKKAESAGKEFEAALLQAPGRRGSQQGLARASTMLEKQKEEAAAPPPPPAKPAHRLHRKPAATKYIP